MRRAKIPRASVAPTANIRKINAPVKGWYTTDSIADAPKDTALVMDNWFCEPDAIRIRGGYTSHATGLGASVQTIMVHTSGTASEMFGCANGSIFDISISGAVGAAAVTGLSSNKWQWTNFSTAGGQFLVACNGADAVRNYDGTTWTTPAITGVSSADLINVWAHQQRLWFIEENTTRAWYLPTSAIAGAATSFEFGTFLRKGGSLMAVGTWSLDSGDGLDDMFVVISTEGEVIVYQGTDPSSAATWGMVGRYQAARPIGRRCFFQVGGDLLILTEAGLLPMSKIIKVDKAVLSTVNIASNIRNEYTSAVQQYKSNFGWQITTLPDENMAILNIPIEEDADAHQFVMNTETGAWSRFTNLSAVSWAYYNGSLYFGDGSGEVFLAESGSVDNGDVMQAFVVPSYSDLGSPGILKHVKQIKPIIASNVDARPGVGAAFDYEDPEAPIAAGGVGVSGFTWDVSNWDEDTWAGTAVYRNWRSPVGIGAAVAPVVSVSVTGGNAGTDLLFRLLALHVTAESGGIMG